MVAAFRVGRKYFLMVGGQWEGWDLYLLSHLKIVCVLSHVQLIVTLWTAAWQAPLSIALSWREYWNELSFPPPGNLPNSGTEPSPFESPALGSGFLTTEPPEKHI